MKQKHINTYRRDYRNFGIVRPLTPLNSERLARHAATRRAARKENILGWAGVIVLLACWILAGMVDAI